MHVAILALDVLDLEMSRVDVSFEMIWLHETCSTFLAKVRSAKRIVGNTFYS
jgi:hypothetical protein